MANKPFLRNNIASFYTSQKIYSDLYFDGNNVARSAARSDGSLAIHEVIHYPRKFKTHVWYGPIGNYF